MTLVGADQWLAVCPLEAIVPDTGVCARVGGDHQVAVFRLGSGELYAVGNHDPYSGANVISRGIVGDREGVPCVASPVYKQAFDLRTGASLEGDDVELGHWAVRDAAGTVQLRVASWPGAVRAAEVHWPGEPPARFSGSACEQQQ